MKTLEIIDFLKTKKDEIISQTINLLPNAYRGDRVNRTFFINENGEVDYFVYLGLVNLTDNCFLTISENESIDLDEYQVEDYDEIDFYALGFAEKIGEFIDQKIENLEYDTSRLI